MRVTANSKLIANRRRYGNYANFAGLGILLVGLLATLRPTQPATMWISLVALVIGFALTRIGTYSLRRWGRSPRPDEIIETALKGFDDRNHYYAWALPTPYVLLSPQGIYAFTVRDQTGEISVTGSQWHTKFNPGRLLLGQEGLGNPTRDALEQAEKLREWIAKELPNLEAPVQPVVVFIDERAKLTVSDPTVPVVDTKGLKKWLRGPGKGSTIKADVYRQLEGLFDARAAGVKSSDVATPEESPQ